VAEAHSKRQLMPPPIPGLFSGQVRTRCSVRLRPASLVKDGVFVMTKPLGLEALLASVQEKP
jgi:hypothetical protein